MHKRAEIKISGYMKPFLYHAFPLSALSPDKVQGGTPGNDPTEWRLTVLHKGRRLFVPGEYIFSSLGEGAKYVKLGRGTIQKKLLSSLMIEGENFFVENRELPENLDDLPNHDPDKDDVYIDVRSVKNPNTKGRNVRYRVSMAPGWELSFSALWDPRHVSEGQFEQALYASGAYCGLGDGRIRGFGRFKVDSIELSDA